MEEEEAVHLKINPTLFVPEQSISGGRVGVEGGGMLKKKKKKPTARVTDNLREFPKRKKKPHPNFYNN